MIPFSWVTSLPVSNIARAAPAAPYIAHRRAAISQTPRRRRHSFSPLASATIDISSDQSDDHHSRDQHAPDTPDGVHIVIIGGGAAGHMAAITCARGMPGHYAARITMLESSSTMLNKVRISGGGRCNVTSGVDADDHRAFVANYPRGQHEMLGVLSAFSASQVMSFFEAEGVPLKMESTGKIFPVSDSSHTVIQALVEAARRAGVIALTRTRVTALERVDHSVREVHDHSGSVPCFRVTLSGGRQLEADYVVIATGSAPCAAAWADSLGHHVVGAVPSLFTFTINDARLQGLAGLSVNDASIELQVDSRTRRRLPGLSQRGPMLITHWGISGPAVLSLSAFGARVLHENKYRMKCVIDWLPHMSLQKKRQQLQMARKVQPNKKVMQNYPFREWIPKRLWSALVRDMGQHVPLKGGEGSDVVEGMKWGAMNNASMEYLAQQLNACCFEICRRGEFKEEFVTAGGVLRSEISTKTFESKMSPQLYFVGEAVDVDGRTGGYNLQFAWASGFIAGRAIAESAAALARSSVLEALSSPD